MPCYSSFAPPTTAWRLHDIRGLAKTDHATKVGFLFEFRLVTASLDVRAAAEMYVLASHVIGMRHYQNALRFLLRGAAVGKADAE